jgi:hypothetical protein
MLPDGFLSNLHVTDRTTAQRQRELFHAPLTHKSRMMMTLHFFKKRRFSEAF